MNKKLIRKMLTAAGGPLRIKFTPEQIALFESRATRVPGMNTSGGDRYKKEGVLALQHLEQETKRKEEEIKSRMEMRPTLKRKVTTAEKLQGKKDEYELTPLVVGMSGTDPVGEFILAGIGLNGVGALAKTGLWNIAKYAPTTQLGNYGRQYFVGNAFKNSFNEAIPTLTSQATSLLYLPVKLNEFGLTSLKFFERPSLSNAQLLGGATKWERNFKPKWHVANYPGYLLKGLMKGSLLEKQLSKNGTININLLNAYFNKASQIEKEVANKVLAEKFAGLKTIDYNLFKKAVLDELIDSYDRVPNRLYENYGIERLGYNPVEIEKYSEEFKKHAEDRATKLIRYANKHYLATDPKYRRLTNIGNSYRNMAYGRDYLKTKDGRIDYGANLNTFTFESPRISLGSDKHYGSGTLGHSRTYTTPEEPSVLHVMESQSDWAQQAFKGKQKPVLMNQIVYNEQTGNFENPNPIEYTKYSPLEEHLIKNYLQRQLQENLKYAAENGLTKMRYPTSETAAKIEGYLKKVITSPEVLDELRVLDLEKMQLWNEQSNLGIFDLKRDAINKRLAEIELREQELGNMVDYSPEHQTILKKYADFPKLFLKLFKDLKVRTVTDAKGNTWYEVDVPKGYLSREWLFKQGGKMNILEFLKNGSGIHIKEKNKGKFTSYCGGKVTDECIRKAKASGNPTLVKRATFAANARKWKHKEGGIIIKAADGTKTNFFLKVGNFLNSDLGKTVGTGLVNAFSSWTSSNKLNNAIDSLIEGLKKQNKADINSIQDWALQKATEEITLKFNELLLLFNSGASFERPSPIVFEHLKSQLASKYAQNAINDANLNSQEAIANLESLKTNPTSDVFSSLVNTGFDYLSNKFANKALDKNGVPSSRNTSASFYSNPYLKTLNKVGTINFDGSMNTGIGGTTYNWKTNTFGSNNSSFKF